MTATENTPEEVPLSKSHDKDYTIDDLPPEDVKRIMDNLPEDDSEPPDAHALSQNELRRELVDRGIQPKGFFNDDAARLQEEYNREHVEAREARRKAIIDKATKDFLEKRTRELFIQQQTQLREETEEIASNAKLDVWINMIKQAEPKYAKLQLNSIGCRAFMKVMKFNASLTNLDLSRNNLDDMAGTHIAKILPKNNSLLKLQLDSNQFGPESAKAFADALTRNITLQYLSLESNPLTKDESDFSGIIALGNALPSNSSLTSLNLWRTRLGSEGGRAISRGLASNDSIICLDFGNNSIAFTDEKAIMSKIRENQAKQSRKNADKMMIVKAQREAAAKERKAQEDLRKAKEHEQWVRQRQEERAEQRRKEEEERQRKLEEAEEQRRLEAERYAAERAAKAEADKKKKGKKKGKK